jgi:cytochrome c oxidase assembly factor CtaG
MDIWVDANGWPISPTVLLGCLVAVILYVRGWYMLVKEEQFKKATRVTTPARTSSDTGVYQSWFWRGIYFLGSIFVFLLTASTPIDVLSGSLFWVHMIQHLLLLVVMAPLLVAGAPLIPVWLGLPTWVRSLVKASARPKVGRAFYRLGNLVGRWLRQPAISCVLLVLGTWIWHWPPLYDFALTHDAIHDWAEHITFQAVSLLFWTQVIPSYPLRPRLGYIGRIGCLGFAIAQNIILAALLGFAQAPLYAPYAHLATLSGSLSAIQDQQFGAGIMWTFGDLPFGIAFSILIQQWLASQSEDTNIAIKSHNAER